MFDLSEADFPFSFFKDFYDNLDEILPKTDVLYMTRMQKERFSSKDDYSKVHGFYKLTPQVLTRAKEKMVIMHPLPRVDEIR